MNLVSPPALDIDALMLSRFGHEVSAEGRLERRIVANLVAHLQAAGFEPVSVYDGEATEVARDTKEVMELVFNLDNAWVRFRRGNGPRHGVFLVLGNGTDIVSDWNYTTGDPDGFDAAMNAFLDRIEELA